MTAVLPTIGVGIGGSKIAIGLVDHDGGVIRHREITTPSRYGRAAIMNAGPTAVSEVVAGAQIRGIGVGAAGVIGAGTVSAATDLLAGWTGTDIVGSIRNGLLVRGIECQHVVAVNDVHAHGAGEVWRGAGAGKSLVSLAAVGPGLGGAVPCRGVPLIGKHGASGHLGRIRSAEALGLRCSCGASGHLEAIVLGYGLVRLYHQLGGDSSVGSARELSEQVSADPKAAEALARSAAASGAAIGDRVNIADPDEVIISGEPSQAEPIWWREVRKAAIGISLSLIGVIGVAGLVARDSVWEGA